MDQNPNQPETDQPSNSQPAPSTEPNQTTPVQDVTPPPTMSSTPAPSSEPTPTEAAPTAQPSVSAQPASTVKKPRSKLMLVSVVLIIIFLLAAGGVGYVLTRPKAVKTATVTVSEIPELHIGTTQGPIGPDFTFPNAASTDESLAIGYQIYEGLVGYQNNKLTPLLATSWTNPDKTTWVFELQHDVTFQNGKPLTPADVKTSIEANMKRDYWSLYTSTIKSVAVTGPNQITITTAQPDSLLLGRLAEVYIYNANSDGSLSGTGAYTFDTSKKSDQKTVYLKAYNSYHQGRPKTQAVTITVFEDTKSLFAAAKSGKVDAFNDLVSAKSAADLKTAGVTGYTFDRTGSGGLHLNTLKPGGALAKLEIRQALNYALDRSALYVSDDASKPSYAAVPKNVIGYDKSAVLPSTDLAKSKALQTAAGYPNGAPITFLYIKGYQTGVPDVIAQLKKAGFVVTEDAVASPDEAFKIALSGKFDIIQQDYFTNLNDTTDLFTGMLSYDKGDLKVYNNPNFEALLAASEAEFAPAAHLAKAQAITKFVNDNVLWIPLSSAPDSVYARTGYQSVVEKYNQTPSTTYFWQTGKTTTTIK